MSLGHLYLMKLCVRRFRGKGFPKQRNNSLGIDINQEYVVSREDINRVEAIYGSCSGTYCDRRVDLLDLAFRLAAYVQMV